MKTKNIILVVVILSTGFLQSIFSQQTPIFANYSYNSVVLNPAHAGFYPDGDITITNRGHINPIEGSPKNLGASVNLPTASEHVGLGGGFYSDRVGITNTTSVFGSYAYKMFFSSDPSRWWSYNPHVLSFGITGGFMVYNENLLELGIDNDPNFAENISEFVPTVGLGVLYNREHIYLGFSAMNLLGDTVSSDKNINIEKPYYIYGGYRFYATRFEEILINPSVLVKHVSGAPVQLDINTKVNYENKFEIGAGYRTNDSVNILAGFYMLNHFRIVYNYNKALKGTPMNDTHGLVLSFRLGEGFAQK